MTQFIKTLLSTLILTISLLTIPVVFSATPNLAQAKKLCNNASMAQKQAAKAAGYDVDEICNSLRNQEQGAGSAFSNQEPSVLPRDSGEQNGDTLKQIEFEEEQKKLPKVERELKKFGYDLFAGEPTTYTPVGNIPVPSNYVVGPGDLIKVQLYGKENENHELQVGRDGAIQFPSLGPIYVSGLSYTELKESLNKQIKEQIIGVEANISMGELRSIQVFVVGEAYRPGAYTVSSLSTILNALYVSGGVKEIGSLRNIQLKRNGKLISRLDLYDLLLKGDARGDRRLRSGDVIYIPSVKKTASVAGEVVRPAIYELKNEKNVGQLVELAGGLLPSAYSKGSKVLRVNPNGEMTVVDVNLSQQSGKKQTLKNGDFLKVYPVLERETNIVHLKGHVYRDGSYNWRRGMRVSDIISSPELLKENANIDFVLLIREQGKLKKLMPIKVNLRDIFSNKNSKSNIRLEERDTLVVLNNNEVDDELYKSFENLSDDEKQDRYEELELSKEDVLELEKSQRNYEVDAIVKQLNAQASLKDPVKIVSVDGAVKYPGEYPLTQGMTTLDLIHAAGGMTEDAFAIDAELSRLDLSNPLQADVSQITIDLQQELLGSSPFILSSRDHLIIKKTPEYRDVATISVSGEVKFPGTFRLQRGETLSQLMKRVGGVNRFAHIRAAVFSRKELRELEQKQLEELQERLEKEISAQQVEKNSLTNKSTNYQSLDKLVKTIDKTEATGRLVIDLEKILSGEADDIVLKDGDKLLIPAQRQSITVVGEVQAPRSHQFDAKYDVDDYIDRSGGEKEIADSSAIYVVKADGSIFLPNKTAWLGSDESELEAGDTIVVPLDTDRINGLELWSQVSSIVYQMALGAAAIKSF